MFDSTDAPAGNHLSKEALRTLVRRSIATTTAFPWLLHLGRCPRCQEQIEILFGDRGRDFLERAIPCRDELPRLLLEAPSRGEAGYNNAVRRAIRSASRVEREMLREEEEAVRLYHRLKGQPPARWELWIQNQPRCQTLGMLNLVLREARRARRADPDQSEQLCRTALSILPRLSREVYGERLLRDRGALAWGYLASALRAQGNLSEADRALRQGEGLLPDDPREAPDETAWLRMFRAFLARDQRRFEEALAALLESRRLFQSLRDREHEAWTEVLEAEILATEGNKEQSAAQLESFLARVAPEEVGELIYLTAIQHLTTVLAELGRGPQARQWMSRLDEVAGLYRDPLNRARIRWTEALVHRALGELERAAEVFRQVQAVFVEHEIGFDAALVSLDLTAVLLELGRSSEALELAEEMVPIFRSLQVDRETVAAALLFIETLRLEQATSAAAKAVARRLKEADRLPPPR